MKHFAQLYKTNRFQLFDYGSRDNFEHYHSTTPPDVGRNYAYLADVPVHILAGVHDGIIPPENTKMHFRAMKEAGVEVTYREVSLWFRYKLRFKGYQGV